MQVPGDEGRKTPGKKNRIQTTDWAPWRYSPIRSINTLNDFVFKRKLYGGSLSKLSTNAGVIFGNRS